MKNLTISPPEYVLALNMVWLCYVLCYIVYMYKNMENKYGFRYVIHATQWTLFNNRLSY